MPSATGNPGNTVQADVEPGDKTGIYYIIVCNLPFGTSWQALKDWTRSSCEVDHVQVFPTSTSGWVRVLGRDNFEKAWGLLNGGSFNGRSIIASDRNRCESIKIKELATPTAGASNGSHAQKTCKKPLKLRSHGVPELMQPSASYAMGSCGQEYYSREYRYEQPALFYTFPPQLNDAVAKDSHGASTGHFLGLSMHRMMRATDPISSVNADLRPSERTNDRAGQLYDHCKPGPSDTQRDEHSTRDSERRWTSQGAHCVYTERRKILITHIDRKCHRADAAAWIRSKIGTYSAKVRDIELPVHESNSQLRGHAYVIFESASDAKQAIALLDQQVYKKRKISARFTTEGVDSSNPVATKASLSTVRVDQAAGKKDLRVAGPVVVDGSLRRSIGGRTS